MSLDKPFKSNDKVPPAHYGCRCVILPFGLPVSEADLPPGQPHFLTMQVTKVSRFLKRPIVLIVLALFLFSIALPIGLAVAAQMTSSKFLLLTLDFLLGTRPGETLDDTVRIVFRDIDYTLASGVGLRAFAIIGIPATLGTVIALLLRGLERRIRSMNFLQYVNDYRLYLRTAVYAKLRNPVRAGTVELEALDEMLQAAFDDAHNEWQDNLPDDIKESLKEVSLETSS